MTWTAEARTLCADPTCNRLTRHVGECDDGAPSYAQTVTRLAQEYRSYSTAGELIPPADYVGIVNRLHAAADAAGIDRPIAARDLFDEINAEPVA
jgi:hypothetical protein